MSDVFAFGERQAFISGQEHGRDMATKLIQLLVASVQQKYDKAGDEAHARAAQDIADILFNYNWGLKGEKPLMPGEVSR